MRLISHNLPGIVGEPLPGPAYLQTAASARVFPRSPPAPLGPPTPLSEAAQFLWAFFQYIKIQFLGQNGTRRRAALRQGSGRRHSRSARPSSPPELAASASTPVRAGA